jgi:hypothetical protein
VHPVDVRFGSDADVIDRGRQVRFVPLADIRTATAARSEAFAVRAARFAVCDRKFPVPYCREFVQRAAFRRV